MSELTLEAIEQMLDAKLDAKLEPINTKLAAIEETVSSHTMLLNNHTNMLTALATDVKILLNEKTVSAHRFDRLEHWAQRIGEKTGIKLEL